MRITIPKDNHTGYGQFNRAADKIMFEIEFKRKHIWTILETGSNAKSKFLTLMTMLNSFNIKGGITTCIYSAMGVSRFEDYLADTDHHHRLVIVSVGDQMTRNEMKTRMETHDMQEMPVLQQSMRQDAGHEIILSKKGQCTYVLTNKQLSWENLYRVMVMHWEWHKEQLSCPNELYGQIVAGFLNDNPKQIEEALDKMIFSNPEIKREKLKEVVDKFKYNKAQALKEAEEKIQIFRNCIAEHIREYEADNRNLQEALENYENIRRKEDKEDIGPILDYFCESEYIEPEIEGREVILNFVIPIIDYDEFLAEDQKFGRTLTEAQILDIFIKHRERFRLWTHATVILDPKNKHIDLRSKERELFRKGHWNYGHPHLNEWTCLGNHPEEIYPFMNQGNWIGCLNQITAMAMNLNFSDPPVVNTMLDKLAAYATEYNYWEDMKTGEFRTTQEVLDIIEEEKANGTA